MLEFMKTLKIATRQSPLALWQAEHIRARLQELHPDLTVELVKFVTQGDKILDTPLAKIGGKGLFVKELEAALLDGRADLCCTFNERCSDGITRRFNFGRNLRT